MTVFAGQGDPKRSMALLWRDRGGEPARNAPGPKPGLSVDAIVAAGVAVADELGMAALSMRAVGQRLGRTAMALYTYVPSKAELVDLMYDQTLAELPTDYAVDAGWRPALRRWAVDNWEFYLRHPWMLQVSQVRPVLGPHEFTSLETLVHILHATGLTPAALRPIVGTLVNFVRGAAQTVAESREAAEATGVSDEQWWASRAGSMAEFAPAVGQRYPLAAWLSSDRTTSPYDDDEVRRTFLAGLTLLLDGIARAAGPEN